MVLDVLGNRSNYTDVLAGSRTFFWGISCYFFPGGWILEEIGAAVSGLGKPYIWGVFNKEGEGLRIETAVIGLSGKVRGLKPIGAKADDIQFQLINVVVVVQSLSVVWLFAIPWMAACQASLSFTISLEFVQIHVHWVSDAIQLSHPLLPPSLPALISLSIRVFSNELALHMK